MIQHHQDREYRLYCVQDECLLNWGFAEHPSTFDWGQGEGEEMPSLSANIVKLRHEPKGVLHPGVNYYSCTDIHSFPTQLIALPKSKTFLHPIPLHKHRKRLQLPYKLCNMLVSCNIRIRKRIFAPSTSYILSRSFLFRVWEPHVMAVYTGVLPACISGSPCFNPW